MHFASQLVFYSGVIPWGNPNFVFGCKLSLGANFDGFKSSVEAVVEFVIHNWHGKEALLLQIFIFRASFDSNSRSHNS